MSRDCAVGDYRQYSVELGLRTHRPSVVTPDYVPVKASIHTTFSTAPQYGDRDDWWDLPVRSSQDYEQKTRSVRISYSSDEIYGKAKVTKLPSPRRQRLKKNKNSPRSPRHTKADNGDEVTKTASGYHPLLDADVADNVKSQPDHIEPTSSSTGLANRQRDHKPLHSTSRNRPLSAGNTKSPSNVQFDFQDFTKNNTRQQRVTAWDESHSHDYHKLFKELEGIKFRTFEEAMHDYPSSDSETSNYGAGEEVADNDQCSVPTAGSSGKSKVRLENMSTMATEAVIPLAEIGSTHSPKHRSDQVAVSDESDELISSTLVDQHAQAHQKTCHTVHVALEDSTSEKVEEMTLKHDTKATETPPKLDLLESFNSTAAVPHSLVDQLQMLEELDISITAGAFNHDETQKAPASMVPPIDLTQLSPKKTKTTSKVRNRSKLSKSTNFGTPSMIGDKPRGVLTKSMDYNKTKQIAQDIKRKVLSNPKEIAREVRQRTEVKKKERSLASRPSEVVNHQTHVVQSSTEQYLLPGSIKSSRRQSLLDSSHLVYNKYITMTPRIQTGDASVWSCLPDEVWLLILSHLPIKDMHSFMLVCSDFNRLAHDRSLWKVICIKNRQLSDYEILKIGAMSPRNLTIKQCTGTKLNGDMVTNHGLMKMFNSCKDTLTCLSVASCVMPPLSGEVLLHHAAVFCAHIAELDVSWCNISASDVELISQSFPQLRRISLSGNQNVNDSSLGKLVDTCGCQLVSLSLQGCFKLTNDALKLISQCSNLQDLNLGLCHKLTSSALSSAIAKLPDLTRLTLKGLKSLKDSSITSIVKRCPLIVHLDVSLCTQLTSRALTEISCSLTDLETLQVASCKDCINDITIATLLSNCKRLKSLDISSTPVTNQTLENISMLCQQLEVLVVNFCSVTDLGVRQLLSNHDTLKSVQLYGIKGINYDEYGKLFPHVDIQFVSMFD